MNIFAMSSPFTKISAAALLAVGVVMALPAAAGTVGGWTRSSTVSDTVTDNLNGTWTYNYTVNNTSAFTVSGTEPQAPILVDWELPWFGDAGISLASIMSPFNWDWSIETIGVANPVTGWEGVAAWQNPTDPFYAGPSSPFTTATQVLHWFNTCWAAEATCGSQFDNTISPGGSLSGFGFVAAFDETPAPYQASWASLPVRTGDPAFPLGAPNSPALQGQSVPEPGALALLGIGLTALALGRRRRG